MKKLLVAALVGMGLVSCSYKYEGNLKIADESLLRQIKRNKTHKSFVRQLLGDPSETHQYSGNEDGWIYSLSESGGFLHDILGSYHSAEYNIFFHFDRKGVVTSMNKQKLGDFKKLELSK